MRYSPCLYYTTIVVRLHDSDSLVRGGTPLTTPRQSSLRQRPQSESIIKINTRSLWFISRDELDKLLKDKDVQVENESREPTGINNLEGVTIYGRFQ